MPQFVIPTIFTGVDRLSAPLMRMGAGLTAFNTRLQTINTSFTNLIPSVSKTTAGMWNFAKSAVGVSAAIAAIGFTTSSLVDYEKELANLKALTGARGKEFQQYKSIIHSVAVDTKTSAVEVAKAFTTVANAMPELLKSAEGLGLVTSSSILLAKAANMELAPAADAVTTILNQFGKGAKDAARLVDMLAAGSNYGSSEIEDLSASMREFGSQARLAGITLQESIGLTELVSKFRKGSQAGIELRNVLIEMSKGSAQDPKAIADMKKLGVNISLVADKTVPLDTRLKELAKVTNSSNALFHIFGKENQAMAATILQNVGSLKGLTEKVGESGNAARMAAENTNTASASAKQFKAAWVNIITASNGANWAMSKVADTIRFVSNHLDGLLNIALPIVGAFFAWKTVLLGVRTALWLTNVATGVNAALTGNLTVALSENALAAQAETVIIRIRTAAMWLATEATVGMQLAILGGVGALIGLVYYLGRSTTETDDLGNSVGETGKKFAEIKKPINEATIAMQEYNKAVGIYNKQQDQRARDTYDKQRNPISNFLSKAVNSPLTTIGMLKTLFREREVKRPELKSFFPNISDTSKIQMDRINGGVPDFNPSTTDTTIIGSESFSYNENKNYTKAESKNIVEVHVIAAPGTTASIASNAGAIPVKIKQTGMYTTA